MKRRLRLLISGVFLVLAGCGDDASGGLQDAGEGADAAAAGDTGVTADGQVADAQLADAGPLLPTDVKTVFLIMMENHNWSDISTSASASYIRQTLLPKAAHAEMYFNPPGLHPSEPNYKWLEAGSNFGSLSDGDPSATNHITSTMHLATLLDHAGISWLSYQEGISGTVCPLSSTGRYAAKHNPFVFFDDLTGTRKPNDPSCIAHNKPIGKLAMDVAQLATTAHYNFITPDLCHDMHDSCAPLNDPIKQGDQWLAATIPMLEQSAAYLAGDAAIFITWDESEAGEHPIGMIVLSPLAKRGYLGTVRYTHSSTLKTMQEIFGVTPLLGDAAKATTTDLGDLFTRFP